MCASWLSFVLLPMVQSFFYFLQFRFWGPPEVPHFCHAHASSGCARDCADLYDSRLFARLSALGSAVRSRLGSVRLSPRLSVLLPTVLSLRCGVVCCIALCWIAVCCLVCGALCCVVLFCVLLRSGTLCCVVTRCAVLCCCCMLC